MKHILIEEKELLNEGMLSDVGKFFKNVGIDVGKKIKSAVIGENPKKLADEYTDTLIKIGRLIQKGYAVEDAKFNQELKKDILRLEKELGRITSSIEAIDTGEKRGLIKNTINGAKRSFNKIKQVLMDPKKYQTHDIQEIIKPIVSQNIINTIVDKRILAHETADIGIKIAIENLSKDKDALKETIEKMQELEYLSPEEKTNWPLKMRLILIYLSKGNIEDLNLIGLKPTEINEYIDKEPWLEGLFDEEKYGAIKALWPVSSGSKVHKFKKELKNTNPELYDRLVGEIGGRSGEIKTDQFKKELSQDDIGDDEISTSDMPESEIFGSTDDEIDQQTDTIEEKPEEIDVDNLKRAWIENRKIKRLSKDKFAEVFANENNTTKEKVLDTMADHSIGKRGRPPKIQEEIERGCRYILL